MQKPAWWSLSFFLMLFLATLSIGSGGFTVVRDLYFYSQAKEPPQKGLLMFLRVCSILASWFLLMRERKARITAQNPMSVIVKRARIFAVSAESVSSELSDGRFVPYGSRFAAICTLYSYDGGRDAKGVLVRLTFTDQPSGQVRLEIPRACWFNYSKPDVNFKAGTFRQVVVAEWAIGQPVTVPKFVGNDLERLISVRLTPQD
jgi:hypothetical protein